MVSYLFSNIILELRAPLRNRTVDLLLTMHAGFVRWHRIGSDYRSSAEFLCLGASRCVCHCLAPLSLSLSLAFPIPGTPTARGEREPQAAARP
jgi:hypothetical protein